MGDIGNVYFKWQEYLENVSLRLEAVHDMVDVVNLEFQHESIGREVVNCLTCIGFCINDIKSDIDKKVVQLAEYNKPEKDVATT